MRATAVPLACAAFLLGECSLLSLAQPEAPPPRPAASEKELEAKFAGRTPEEQLAALDRLAQEWLARRGAVELAHRRFAAQAEELQKLRTRLDAKEREPKAIPVISSEKDVDEAIAAAGRLAEHHAERVRNLEAAVAASGALLKFGAEFAAAARGLSQQSDALQAARKFATGVPPEELPAAFAAKVAVEAGQRLKMLTGEVGEVRDRAKGDLVRWGAALKDAKAASAGAGTRHEELKAAREGVLASLQFEARVREMKPEPLAGEFARLRKELAEKAAAIKGDAADYVKATAAADEARAKLAAVKEPPTPPEVRPAGGTPLEEVGRQLFAARQYLAARLRAANERAENAAALLAALDELEKKAAAYAATLDGVRQGARQLETVSAEIARRVARGDLEAAKAPEGVAEAAGAAIQQAKLGADAAAVREALTKLSREREALRKPDPGAENLKAMTTTLLAHVTARIDRLTDFKKLAADSATRRHERPEAEQRRLDQRAADRMARESPRWEPLVALDRSKPAADLSNLLGAYYQELVELEEKQEGLARQRQLLEGAAELSRKEADDIGKLRAVLEQRPEQPEAARQFDAWLAARLAPSGLKAEAETYRDEVARLNAASGANARRVQALTGHEAPADANRAAEQARLPATGGEIGHARQELFEARARGWTITGIKVGLILLGALILPRLVLFILRRAIRGGSDAAGNPSPALGPLRAALKFGAWVAALALVLSVFGFEVTALVVGLAIGALAVGLAARPMIADALGSLAISAERRFQVGDVVRLGGGEAARVVDLTWRSTALKNASGLVVSVPNRKVTEGTVENLSRGAETYDSLAVTISTDKDAGKVINVIRAAMSQCKNVSPDHGVSVVSYNHKGPVKVVQYRFWWFLKDYEARNKTRDEVFARIALGLAHEDMSGIEVTLA